MIMSIAWLCDQGLCQCLSPVVVWPLTYNQVVTFLLAVRLVIILSPVSFCEHFVIYHVSRLSGQWSVDPLSPCCVTTDQWSCCHLFTGCVSKITILSHVSYGREASDHLITCLSFRLSIGSFTIVSWLCGSDHLITSIVIVWPEATSLVIWPTCKNLKSYDLMLTWGRPLHCPVCVTIYLAIRYCQKKAIQY
jgi:hypothetical protein